MVATAMPVGTEQGAQQSYGFRAWLVVFSAALFFFFEFIQLNMFNALDPALIKSFHISGASLGNLSGNYFYANVIFLFTAGMVLALLSTEAPLSLHPSSLGLQAELISLYPDAALLATYQQPLHQ